MADDEQTQDLDLDEDELDELEGDDSELDSEVEVDPKALLDRLTKVEEGFASIGKVNAELKTSIGRFQSLIDRLPKDGEVTKTMQAQMDSQVDAIHDLLSTLASGLDDDILEPDVKRRVLESVSQRKQERQSATAQQTVVEQVLKQLGINTEGPQGPTVQDAQAMVERLSDEMESLVTDAGLDSSEIDWNAANEALKAGGERGLRKYFATYIRDALLDSERAQRRQRRKQVDDKAPRGGVGTPRTPEAILADPNASLDERRKVLRDMGLNV